MAQRRHIASFLAAGVFAAGVTLTAGAQDMTSTPTPPKPPVAATKAHEVKAPFGATRQDEYYWLRDDTRKNADMLAYLKAENAAAGQAL